MTYCGPLFEGLERRLAKKMTLDEIAKEVCNDVDDPRGKVIRLIKVHKSKDWLCENADWLGYDVSHIRNPVGPIGKKMDIISDSELIATGHQLGQLAIILKNNHVSTNEQQGTMIYGHLDEDVIKHICHIDPYKEEGFHFVTVHTFIPSDDDDGDDDDENGFRMKISCITAAFEDDYIDEAVDFCFYPISYIEKVRKVLNGELTEFPVPPRFKKSIHPDWEWNHLLSDRSDRNRWI